MKQNDKTTLDWVITLTLLLSAICTDLHAQGLQIQNTCYYQESYCTQTEGITLKYANYNKSGEIDGYYIQKMVLCDGNQAKGTFAYDQYFYTANGEPLFKDNNIRMDVTIRGDGSPTESTMSGIKRIMKAQHLMTKGDVSTLPGDIQLGNELPDSEVILKMDGINSSLLTKERNVVDHKIITTPAGSFDCYQLNEVQTVKSIVTQTEKLVTWYAKGIGVVKQEIYNKKGHHVRSMELIEVTVD